jgi:hypothetical protein
MSEKFFTVITGPVIVIVEYLFLVEREKMPIRGGSKA